MNVRRSVQRDTLPFSRLQQTRRLIFATRAGAAIGIPSRMTQVLVPFHGESCFFWQNSEIRGDGLEGWPAGGRAGANFRELIRSNQVVLQQMKRQFTRHAQHSGRAYHGSLAHPTIRSDQAQTELRPVRTGPVGLLVDCKAGFRENRRLQRLLRPRDGDGHS